MKYFPLYTSVYMYVHQDDKQKKNQLASLFLYWQNAHLYNMSFQAIGQFSLAQR